MIIYMIVYYYNSLGILMDALIGAVLQGYWVSSVLKNDVFVALPQTKGDTFWEKLDALLLIHFFYKS